MIVDALEEPLVVRGGRPVFEFETSGSDSWPVWDRFISLRGGPRFHVGNICNTCDFFFRRVSEGAPDTEPARVVADILNNGISALRDAPIGEIAAMMPDGAYRVVFSVGEPHLVHPGDPNDFFSVEQVELWKADPSIARGPIHQPGTDYYRIGSRTLGNGRAFYEFVIPTIGVENLRSSTVEEYRRRSGSLGTALAVSVFDVKGPALFDDTPPLDITEHATLTHYLLDGNHKIRAASVDHRAASILSFIAMEHSVAAREDVAAIVIASQS